MDEIKLSDDVIEQIKDFDKFHLTKEQESLVDKIILNEELRKRYKFFGLCEECKQLNTYPYWCQSCNSRYFQQNFKNWTSGNHEVDEFIKKTQLRAKKRVQILEWIEYDKFDDVEYLAKGGFGSTFKADWKDGYILCRDYKNNQWERNGETKVALKCLHNSQDITAEFLKEVESTILACEFGSGFVVFCFGITKDPKTNNFMMVMDLKGRNLRQHLNDDFNSLNWMYKLRILKNISFGLSDIHNSGLIHRDFHCGNILSDIGNNAYITDLGLCQPANMKSDNKKIYGVLPYVDPEVLRGKEYTKESDIYGFGIIAYEICTGLPPYHDIAHDEFLAIKICHGLRPKSNYKIPQLIFDTINRCWDADLLKRPKADELQKLFTDIFANWKEDSVIDKQIDEANEINEKSSSSTVQSPSSSTSDLSYMTHPQAVYTSRLLDFKNLPKPKNADNNDNLLGIEDSESTIIDFTKLDFNSKD
ncbi:kinase-like domain-containing protein [Rhizophagus irregularis DAOM 181602=DAOM 197198]|uniref:Kinase-like domain-containing protein n=1 Tax=Rhizophagus irregularis (strain DAOM 181602 / DAOM 197198 / MUCL 43194) TaxID=747089 RepID=A0A2H5UI25_RHIID|nr:kinase-like domain-containing protein [Rhizophagus irregularis DAOM 181602=DAOM 197198]POG78640.1 kinase-like domain-containing protein [Rhizophagus irregularis DAOM 181602=DAOM 197198]|eukprot:XP_025185506.1 kinase-like domain-containing protein [Rhizophagus irregularis DAOM 181602=DAOM 197198]